MRSSVVRVGGACTARRANDGSSLVLPTRNSSDLELAAVLHDARERPAQDVGVDEVAFHRDGFVDHGRLAPDGYSLGSVSVCWRLVLALLVGVRDLARLVALEEEHLGDALVGVDLGGQRRGVGDLEGDDALPLRLERRHVHDDPAARVGRLADADREHVARDAEVLDGAREGEGVGRDDADVALEVDEGARVEVLGVDDRGVDVGEDLELVGDADVVAVGRDAVRDHARRGPACPRTARSSGARRPSAGSSGRT